VKEREKKKNGGRELPNQGALRQSPRAGRREEESLDCECHRLPMGNGQSAWENEGTKVTTHAMLHHKQAQEGARSGKRGAKYSRDTIPGTNRRKAKKGKMVEGI